MESNTTNEYLRKHSQLTQPHFDEEATLLSARRVVPLLDVSPEAPPRRLLALALVTAVAVLVGALVGTLIFKQTGEKQAPDISGRTGHGRLLQSEILAGAGGAMSDAQPASLEDEAEVIPPRMDKNRVVAIPKPSRQHSGGPGREWDYAENRGDDELDEREMRRAERIEARRLRREAKREGRGHKKLAADDVLRIREIFEGSPRP